MLKEEYLFREGCFISELHNTPDDPGISVARARVLPGESTKWHSLSGITERYLILEGAGIVETGDLLPRETHVGDLINIPPGMRQRITNDGSTDLIFLAICTPRFTPDAYNSLI
ncbi:MAG: cupin domain-containing protein [Bacteroidota bacterium]